MTSQAQFRIKTMMAMREDGEEKGLLGALKPPRRYGSTSVNMKKPDQIVLHEVSKSDTIQGISLKYGVTVELIKQHNKLWSSGSMFLHKFLEIPVTQTNFECLVRRDPSIATLSLNKSSESKPNGLSSQKCKNEKSSNSTLTSVSQSSSSLCNTSKPGGLHDCSEKTSNDFLSKIDSDIAQMKSNIAKMEVYTYPMLDQMELDDSNQSKSSHKRQISDPRPYPSCWSEEQTSYQNGSSSPSVEIVQNPNRKVTMSLKRLLRDHDSLYEL